MGVVGGGGSGGLGQKDGRSYRVVKAVKVGVFQRHSSSQGNLSIHIYGDSARAAARRQPPPECAPVPAPAFSFQPGSFGGQRHGSCQSVMLCVSWPMASVRATGILPPVPVRRRVRGGQSSPASSLSPALRMTVRNKPPLLPCRNRMPQKIIILY
ncbi:uncharacterized protein BKA78DRAFT_168201 [Phyllosticta capitalensis]|uniref:uncharacterized protein n=1 Tax=Phyllosticta capitalensis TaxID=121624 RepID=UPI00312D4EBC